MASPLEMIFSFLYLPGLASTHFTYTLLQDPFSNILAPGPSWWLFLSKAQWVECTSANFPGNQWANLNSIPHITGNLLFSPETGCCNALPTLCHEWWDVAPGFCFKHMRSPFSKPLMMLTLGSFFGLEAKQEQGFLAYGVQPNTVYQNFRDEVNAVLEKIL